MAKTPYVFPIIGGRKVEHLHDNITALTLKLTDAQVHEIECEYFVSLHVALEED